MTLLTKLATDDAGDKEDNVSLLECVYFFLKEKQIHIKM